MVKIIIYFVDVFWNWNAIIITFRTPNQQKKTVRPIDEVIMSNYDKNAVKTVSKCLAHIRAYWDPEFQPSVEEIVDYR